MTKAVFLTRTLNWVPLVFVLLLPVLLSGVGVWEVLRGTTTRAECQATAARLSARIEALQALEQQDPGATVRSGRDRAPIPVGAAVTRLQRAHDAAATDLLVCVLVRARNPGGMSPFNVLSR